MPDLGYILTMNVHDLDPFYAPMSPPEVSDAELNAVDERDVRVALNRLLREKRAPAVWHELHAIGKRVAERIADLKDTLPTDSDLDSHIARTSLLQRWTNLGQVILVQRDWHLRQVQVSPDELNALVTRWLLLKYGHPEPKPTDGGVPIGPDRS